MADYRRYQEYGYDNYNQNYSYIEGNAVRKLAPSYEPDVQVPERKVEPKRDPQKEAQIRRNREKNNVIDFKYTVLITCACLLVFAACVGYLQMQAQISAQKSNIREMQSQLNQITNENVALEEQLNSSVDLNAIYKQATSELGMKYADSKHTILYASSNPDYVRQYKDIPSNK